MKSIYIDENGIGKLKLLIEESEIKPNDFESDIHNKFHTIAWNKGKKQNVMIDEATYCFEENMVLPIMLNQSFKFENPKEIVFWRFNREFYCIVDRDSEVGCVGFIFFGPCPIMFVTLDEEQKTKLQSILELFLEEFESDEDIKGEMLRMLLAKLIIFITRLAKKQYFKTEEPSDDKFNIIRKFNLLVEIHFREEHQISFYAELLNKSPKTISNYFSLYSNKTPLQIIHDRIINEAKRMFYYTDKSVKEISTELGFEDPSHFSKFFKKCTKQNPTEIKK